MKVIEDYFAFDIESKTLCVWGDDEFIAMLKEDKVSGLVRLSVRRTGYDGNAQSFISWEDLQRIKNECLGEEQECIELYPKESDVVNKNNERHLWLYDGECPYRFPKVAAVSDEDAVKIIMDKLGLSDIIGKRSQIGQA